MEAARQGASAPRVCEVAEAFSIRREDVVAGALGRRGSGVVLGRGSSVVSLCVLPYVESASSTRLSEKANVVDDDRPIDGLHHVVKR